MMKSFLKLISVFFCLQCWLGAFAADNVTVTCDCQSLDDSVTDAKLVNEMGYTHIDSLTRGVGGSTIEGDDCASKYPLKLPFDFRLFSHKIDEIYVNVNGSISDLRVGSYTHMSLDNYDIHNSIDTSKFMIAPYWADLHMGDSITSFNDPDWSGNGFHHHKCGEMYYKYIVNGKDTVGLKILWHKIGFFWSPLACIDGQKSTFELTLTNGEGDFNGNNIFFCYKEIGFAAGSVSHYTPEDGVVSQAASSYTGGGVGFPKDAMPATVGMVYREGDHRYFYQVGQYDRPDSSEVNRKPDGTYYVDFDGPDGKRTTYSGFGTLLVGSKNCELAYDLRNKFSVNVSECNGKGMFTASIFAALGTENNGDNVNYKFTVDGAESYVQRSANKSYIRYDTLLVADGRKHTVKFFVNDTLVDSCEIEAPLCPCPDDGKITIDGMSIEESFSVCKDQLLRIGFQTGIPLVNPQYVWTFGNDSLNVGNESQDKISNFSTSTQGSLALRVTSDGCEEGVNFAINLNVENCLVNSCNDCPSRFSPTPGEKYVVSGWVSAASQIGVKDSFEGVSIQLSFDLIGGGDPMVVECYPDGNIIDGWQRISKSFVIPQNAEKMRIALKNGSGDNRVYFDDIRFHPFNASVKSYVYDPKTLRLAAELDDENYATFYEYDEEGALVRIKKETERGVMTIREARQSKPKN